MEAVTKTIKIKPVEPSEIRDKKILREAIAQIHRKPTAEDLAYAKELEDFAKRMLGQSISQYQFSQSLLALSDRSP